MTTMLDGRVHRARPTLCLVAALLVTGCAATPVAAPAPAAASAVATTDVAWTQLMIALDEKVLTVLALAPSRSTDADLVTLTKDVAAQHHSEVSSLKNLLTSFGVPDDNPHKGHEMPGMISAAGYAELDAATGSGFDRLLAAALRAHLDQCLSLARSELKAGSDTIARGLAGMVEQTRAAFLARLPQQ